MSYEIIPNWNYMGKPVYTNTANDSVLDIPVAIPILATSNPDVNSMVGKSRATAYPIFNEDDDDSDTNGPKKLKTLTLREGSHLSRAPSFGSPLGKSIQIEKKTIYHKTKYPLGYEKLGKLVDTLQEKGAFGQTYYYFSENPEKEYDRMDLFYDPNEPFESSKQTSVNEKNDESIKSWKSGWGGKLKSRKMRKSKKMRKTRKYKK
jgi:hypothetical protein